MNDAKPDKLAALFDESEILVDIKDIKDKEQLLRVKGIVPMTKAAKMLGLNAAGLRKFAFDERESGSNVYQQYGMEQVTGKWRLHMPTFVRRLPYFQDKFGLKKAAVKHKDIPADIGRTKFFRLKGVYKLADVLSLDLNNGKGFLPIYKHEVIQSAKDLPREICGVFQGRKLWYVDFEIFLPWVYHLLKGIPLDEAQGLIAELRGD